MNVFHYLRSKNMAVYEATIKSIVAGVEIFQNRFDLIVDDLIEFYNSEMMIIEEQGLLALQNSSSQSTDTSASKNIVADERLNRQAVPEILKRCANLISANSFKKIFDFFITKGCLD